jgi:predicted nucleic acid-binding protein
MHQEARSCIRTLLRAKETVFIVPQVIFEFWVVATRPIANNGLGLSLENAKRKIKKAESFFRLALDTQPIYREWLRLVDTYAVSGLPAHDARIVAAMKVHAIDRLVTFNTEDFKRFHRKEITVLSPSEVTASLAT